MIISVVFAILILIVLSFLIQISQFESVQNYRLEEFLKSKNIIREQLKISVLSNDPEVVSVNMKAYLPEGWSSRANKTYWGGYKIVSSSVGTSRDTLGLAALVGSQSVSDALVLKDVPERIVLSQFATIRGGCNFSSAKLYTIPRSSSQNFERSGDENIITSSAGWNSGLEDELIDFETTSRSIIEDYYLASSDMLPLKDTFTFLENSAVFYAPDTLKDQNFNGNMVLMSRGKIFVDSTCTLNGVWIIADEVEMGPGFKGNVHITAKKSVVLDSCVTLLYPSSIAIIGEPTIKSELIVQSKASIEGVIRGVGLNPNSTLHFSSDTHFIGEVFWKGKAELKGKLDASCFVYSLFSSSTSAYTENSLHEVSITPDERSDFFLSPRILSPSVKNGFVVKWLN